MIKTLEEPSSLTIDLNEEQRNDDDENNNNDNNSRLNNVNTPVECLRSQFFSSTKGKEEIMKRYFKSKDFVNVLKSVIKSQQF